VTLQPRDRRALAYLAVAAILALVYRFWPESAATAIVAPTGDSVSSAENRLARLREVAATVEAKEAIFKKVSTELAAREKAMIIAESPAQAQAQLIQIVRRLGMAENPPVEPRSFELGAAKPLGDAYGEVDVAVQMECRIDQLVNILAGLSSLPELVTLNDLRITSSGAKEKTVNARVTLAAVVPRKLVPDRSKNDASSKGGRAF
jgi:Tfp pilus assembly protein PilO